MGDQTETGRTLRPVVAFNVCQHGKADLVQDQTIAEGFTQFVAANEQKLRNALTATLGIDTGKDAAAEALAHGWEHWERVQAMENPLGYL